MIVCACVCSTQVAQARDLSFQDRVRAQLAIERVYYAHQIGATHPFEEVVPLDLVERKVAASVDESQALDRVWHTPVTVESLQAEWARMVRQTRMPDRLLELRAALGNDSYLIQECLVRPILVHRLALRAKGIQTTLDGNAIGRLESPTPAPAAGISETPAAGRTCVADDTWLTPTTTTGAPAGRLYFSAVWTGSLMIIWGGATEPFQAGMGQLQNTGGRYDPAIDSWTPTTTDNAPSPRAGALAVWTGSDMLVWGGGDYFTGFDTGGRYDPERDTWTPISAAGTPAQGGGLAFWTGKLMLIWRNGSSAGGRYSPDTDTWTPMSTIDQAPFGFDPAGVWTGHEMIVWGGDPYESAGGRYDPVADRWSPTSTLNAPAPRSHHTAVWTGTEMIVWGGDGQGSAGYTYFNDGGRYDPVTDSWRPLASAGSLPGRIGHSAVWSGRLMLIWGGTEFSSIPDYGARYDPAADSWSLLSGNGPVGRVAQSSLWTGDFMLVWGGLNGTLLTSGGEYCACTPATFFLDSDGDGYGDPRTAVQACERPAGYVTNGADCDDSLALVHPGAPELCNGIDDDCNGQIDEQTAPSAACNDGDTCTADFCQAGACAHTAAVVPRATCAADPSVLNPISRGKAFTVTVQLIDQCSGQNLDATTLSPFHVSGVASPTLGTVTLPIPDTGPDCIQDGIWETPSRRVIVSPGTIQIHFQTPADGLCSTLDGDRQDIMGLFAGLPAGEGAQIFFASTDSADGSLQCSANLTVSRNRPVRTGARRPAAFREHPRSRLRERTPTGP